MSSQYDLHHQTTPQIAGVDFGEKEGEEEVTSLILVFMNTFVGAFAIGFMLGKIKGFNEAQEMRDKETK